MMPRFRESFQETMLQICETLARCRGGGCPRRDTAALITDEDWSIIGLGYNGPPAGMVCDAFNPCPGMGLPSGKSDVDGCIAVHGEENAILRVAWPWRVRHLFTIASPCLSCAKSWIALGGSDAHGKKDIYCRQIYNDPRALNLLADSGMPVYVIKEGDGYSDRYSAQHYEPHDLRSLAENIMVGKK